MRIHSDRAALAVAALAELGAVLGALLCWLFLLGRTLLWDGPLGANELLGGAIAAILIGARSCRLRNECRPARWWAVAG